MSRFIPMVLLVLVTACGGGGHADSAPHDGADPGVAKTPSEVIATESVPAPEPVPPRPALPNEVGGPAPSFLPDVGPPEPVASAALRPPGAPVARAPSTSTSNDTNTVVVSPGTHEIVVMPSESILSGLDMRSPLVTARSVVWRLFLGIVVLLGVHTLIARARRKLPKLQDDLLLVQLGSVVTVLLLTVVSVVRTLERASPLVAGASLLSIGLVVVWIGVRFLPRYIEGLYLVLGPTVRIGDWVSIDGDSGILDEVGLTRLTLIREDGRRFSVPVASLGGARFSVQPRDHSAPVDVVVGAGSDPERLRRRLLAAAQVSPYRDPDTPVSAAVNGDSLRVHFVAWSPDVVEHAVRHLRHVRARLDPDA